MSEKFILGAADYAIFGTMLAISATIGLYFRIFGGRQKTNEEYLLAGKNMSILPVSFSLMATFMSATTLIGIPAEMYLFGTNMAFMNIGFILGPIISSFVFLPIYFNAGVSTAYEYLEKRFGRSTRRILSGIFLIQHVLFNGVMLYAPALALSAVTNLPIWTSVISTGIVCTFYCTLGGMKAVVWTDVFQAFLMYICLFAIIIKGCIDLGGLDNIFASANDGGRILLPTFDFDFSVRYTMWSVFLQGLIITTNSFGCSQIQVQRQLTLKNLKRSRITTFLSIPMIVAFQLLCCLCGIIFYVAYKSCDPMTSLDKHIHSADQLMPYYITSAMRQYPGLPGLCIAGIFSASLSSLSSAVNSMAAVTYEDIFRPFWPNLSKSVFITKSASVFYGILSVLVTYIVSSMGNLVKASLLVIGMVSGPTFGVYLLAALTSTANEIGANLGVVAGVVLAGCLTFIPNPRHYQELSVGQNCSLPSSEVLNYSVSDVSKQDIFNDSDPINTPEKSYPHDNFPVSYMWISPLSLVVCIVVGYIASWIVSCFKGYSKVISPELLSPVRNVVCKKKHKLGETTWLKDSQAVTSSKF